MPTANRAFPSADRPQAPAVVWAIGDVYERGTARDFRDRFASVYGPLARRTAPTPGNHDWPNHDVGYDPYWRSVTGAATPPWYSFRIGGWEVLSLNSEAPHGTDSPQVRWLQAHLRRSTGTCRLAFWHRPLQSAGHHGDQSDVSPLWNSLTGRAALVLNGHDHDSQRLRPKNGIVAAVAGAGGHGRYGVDGSDRRLAFAIDSADGGLRLRLRPGRAELEFVAVDGRTLDRSSVGCARSA